MGERYFIISAYKVHMEDSEETQEKVFQHNEDSQDSQEDAQDGVVSFPPR